MARFLFFDTETTGISRKTDRIVQLAWVVADEGGRVLEEENHLIKPVGFSIPKFATGIHGITNEQAEREGQSLGFVLKKFSQYVSQCTILVAHNIPFDLGMLRSELARTGIGCDLEDKLHMCTMRLSTNWCRLPKNNGSAGYKLPKLKELHYRLFGEYFDGEHDALSDVNATKRSFFELVEREIIQIPHEILRLGVSSETRNNVKTETAHQIKKSPPHHQRILTYANGDEYVGDIKEDTAHGEGTYTFANGDKYVGELKAGELHGQGYYNYANGNKYVGDFNCGSSHGQGTLTYADGEEYVGEFRVNELHGQGRFTYANGDNYVGDFKEGAITGHGCLTSAPMGPNRANC